MSNPSPSETSKYWVLLFFKGMAMGAADVVPGVSGGTIAFISGIYERLLTALKSLQPASLLIWYRHGFSDFWRAIDGRFLLTLFCGVIVSILSFAKLIHFALEDYPIVVWSFFFGLVVASIILLLRQVLVWRWQECLMLALGTAIAVTISVLRPAELPDTWWMMMLSGFIAICAMILPGISGSFILLLMGMYSVFIRALNDLNVLMIASFGLGCIAGLLIFSHILSLLLKRYLSMMLALLTGFLIGSLNVLWPWKQVLETMVNRHGEVIPLVQTNISPFNYEVIHSSSSFLLLSIIAACVGFLIIFLLDRLSLDQ